MTRVKPGEGGCPRAAGGPATASLVTDPLSRPSSGALWPMVCSVDAARPRRDGVAAGPGRLGHGHSEGAAVRYQPGDPALAIADGHHQLIPVDGTPPGLCQPACHVCHQGGPDEHAEANDRPTDGVGPSVPPGTPTGRTPIGRTPIGVPLTAGCAFLRVSRGAPSLRRWRAVSTPSPRMVGRGPCRAQDLTGRPPQVPARTAARRPSS